MAYKALVARARVRPHPKSDNGLLIVDINGYQVITGAKIKDNDLIIFFESGGVIAPEILSYHNEFRSKYGLNANQVNLLPEQWNDVPGGFFEESARVRSIKLRGERSDGFVVTPEFFSHIVDPTTFFHGQTFDELNGVKVCWKYVSPATRRAQERMEKTTGRRLGLDMFHEHFDTENLRHMVHTIPDGARVIITEKLHGSSGRTGCVLADDPLPWWKRLAAKFGLVVHPTRSWQVVTGTRKVVRFIGEEPDLRPDLAGEDQSVRREIHRELAPRLHKGETIYYEIVGHWENGSPIFSHSIPEDEIGNAIYKAFKKFIPEHWGRNFHYVYGTQGNRYEVYVYRITQTNVDGQSVDLSWEQIQTRCKVLGLQVVPEIAEWRYKISRPNQEDEITALIPNRYDITYQGPVHWDEMSYEADVYGPSVLCKVLDQLGARASTLDPRHISEGVCVRIEHPDMQRTVKYKGFHFCMLEGIRYTDPNFVDREACS